MPPQHTLLLFVITGNVPYPEIEDYVLKIDVNVYVYDDKHFKLLAQGPIAYLYNM